MAKENSFKVDLSDRCIDLSTYRPDKALHLEWDASLCRVGKASKDSQIVEFRNYLPLIWKYREGICNTPELSNITDEGLGAGASFAGFYKIPLGALLIKYNDGLLQSGFCHVCQCPKLGYYSARGLSGHGWHHDFCPNCGCSSPQLEGRLDELLYNRKQLCPVVETPWTLHGLIVALKMESERIKSVDE